MSNINVETKMPQGPQVKESLTPAATPMQRGLAVVYGSDQFHAAKVAAAGGAILGIVEEDAVAGLPVSVVLQGQCVAQIGAAVTPLQKLAVNASAELVPAASGDVIVATALSGNPNAGDFITVLLSDSTGTKA
jgi:hypothetical protein